LKQTQGNVIFKDLFPAVKYINLMIKRSGVIIYNNIKDYDFKYNKKHTTMNSDIIQTLKKILTDPNIGVDAWSDSFIEDAVKIFKELINKGKGNKCFELLKELNTESQVRFLEAITEVEEHSMLPKYFKILENTEDINLAEPILDGLRGWDLNEDDKEQLKIYGNKFKGKSKLLDVILIKEKTIELTELIKQSFKNVTLGEGVSWHEAGIIDDNGTLEERKNARSRDEKNDWTKIPLSLLENLKYQSVLPFLDTKGLKFYLPILMNYSITNYTKCDSLIINCLIYTLIDKERANELKAVLNQEQKMCVIHFLKFCLGIGDDYFDITNVEKSLENYWTNDIKFKK